MALATICVGIRTIGEEIFLMAAEALADLVTENDLEKGSLYPPLANIQECSVVIARKVADYAYKQGIASVFPEPEDKESFIRAQMYDTKYVPAVPSVYPYPH